MTHDASYPEPVSKLLTLGDPRGQREWLDYRALGLTAENVPALVEMALDEDLNMSDPVSDEVWAPLHAWRALGQLGAGEAAESLTGLLYRIDEHGDDWVGEELPEVFGMIGPAAIPALSAYLANGAHGLWARIAAAHGLSEIGQRHPEAREACVAALTQPLKRFRHDDPTLNGFVISYLLELDAVEAVPLMRRAFAADAVDLMVVGDWEDVQIELGMLDERRTPKSRFELIPDLPPATQNISTPQETSAQQRVREIGRNDPCWCGSGKKYKYCHLREDQALARG